MAVFETLDTYGALRDARNRWRSLRLSVETLSIIWLLGPYGFLKVVQLSRVISRSSYRIAYNTCWVQVLGVIGLKSLDYIEREQAAGLRLPLAVTHHSGGRGGNAILPASKRDDRALR